MNAQWLFAVCSAQRHPIMQCFSPLFDPELLWSPCWVSGLVLPSKKVPRWWRRENFTLSILPVFLVQFISLLMFVGSYWPCGLATCDRGPSGQQTGPNCFSQQAVCWHGMSWALSQQLVVFIALGAGSYLGALSVGAPLVTLYGELIRQSEQNPGARRPNSVPGTTTSQTVKVICHILLQHFNSSSWVCWIDYSIFKGTRCSCTGLWAGSDSETFTYCLC